VELTGAPTEDPFNKVETSGRLVDALHEVMGEDGSFFTGRGAKEAQMGGKKLLLSFESFIAWPSQQGVGHGVGVCWVAWKQWN